MHWYEEMKNNVTDIGALAPQLGMDEKETKRMQALCEAFPMSVPRYYLSLIDWDDPNDPIRKMCIPTFLKRI